MEISAMCNITVSTRRHNKGLSSELILNYMVHSQGLKDEIRLFLLSGFNFLP